MGKNRRSLAEKIAQQIPTLSVASDIGMGTDGLVTVENTKFDYSNWILVSGIAHSAMRYSREMIPIVQNFWANPQIGRSPTSLQDRLIRHLRQIPGMTDSDYRYFKRSPIIARLPEDLTLHQQNDPWGVNRVYLALQQECLYAGYVGLIHSRGLRQSIKQIQSQRF